MSAFCCCLQVCYDLTRRVFNYKMSYLLFTVVFGSRGDYSARLRLSRFRRISTRLQNYKFSLPICKGAKNICGDWGRFCHYVNVVLWNNQSNNPKCPSLQWILNLNYLTRQMDKVIIPSQPCLLLFNFTSLQTELSERRLFILFLNYCLK